jgi:ferredoxin-NADP reductase
MQARITEKREVAKGTLLVEFDLLGEEVDFTPGQYFWVTLVDPPYDDDKGPRRHITVVTSPNDRGVLGLATRVRDSAFKRSLAELPVGAEVEVEQPKGDFLLPADTEQEYVFIAGGIGITVFRSMLRYIAEENLPHRVTLIYSNRDRESTAFLDELQELERRNPNLRLVLTMTEDPEWDGDKRRIDAGFLRDHLDDDLGAFTYLVAGPPGMVEAMETMLRDAGVPEEQVRPERFSGY